jgi:iron-sulfur cluster repair protein YtfE (RIC family)
MAIALWARLGTRVALSPVMEATLRCTDQVLLERQPKPVLFAAPAFGQRAGTYQEALRIELQTLARLSGEEHRRLAARYPDLFPRLHFAISRLRDVVLTHFENEEALLLPLLRRLEEGGADAAPELRRLLPELVAEHQGILTVLASIRAFTCRHPAESVSPLLNVLLSSLRRFDRHLYTLLYLEEQDWFARLCRGPRSNARFDAPA